MRREYGSPSTSAGRHGTCETTENRIRICVPLGISISTRPREHLEFDHLDHYRDLIT